MDQKGKTSGRTGQQPVKALPANGVAIAANVNTSPLPASGSSGGQPGSARRSSKALLPKLGKDGEVTASDGGSGTSGTALNKNPSAKSLVTASPPANGHPSNGSGEFQRPASGRGLRTGSIKGSPFALLQRSPAPTDADHEKQRLEDMATMNQTHTVVHGQIQPARSEADDQYEDLDRKVLKSATFKDLYRIVRMCSAQPSCHRMVLTLEREALKLVNASCVRIFLVGRDGLTNRTRSYELGIGLVGHVIKTKDLINIVNPAQDDRYVQSVDELPKEGPASALMCLPVEADTTADCDGAKDIVAIIQAFKHDPNASFTSRDCRVLYRLGEFAGNLLRNSRNLDRAHALYSQATISHKRSQALLDVAKVLSSEHRLDAIINIIVSQVPELLDADRCTLFFVDKEKQQLVVRKGASQGRKRSFVSWVFGQFTAPELPFEKGSDEIRFSMQSGIAGFVATGGETLNLLDAHLDPRFNPKYDKETGYRTRSVLCVPMIDANNEIIGVLQTINKNPLYPRFNEEDETLVKTFSAQAALAVRNSQLFEKTESAKKQSEALLEVTNALSSELKIEELVKIIVVKVQQLLESERCTVFIVDQKRKEMYTSANMSHGLGAPLPINREKSNLIYFPLDRGIAGRVATTGKTINIPDAYKDDRFNKSFDTATGFRTKSILCQAIRNHLGEIIGVTQVMNKMTSKQRFMDDDEKLLAAFNAQSAVAIENSRLFQQTERALNSALADQRNLKFMLSVTKNLFSDMHLTSMIEQMTMQVHHLLKADDCALYLVNVKTREFYLAKDESDPQVRRHKLNVGIVGHVASTGATVRISSNAMHDARFHPDVDQRKNKVTHSILCCPIKSDPPEGSGEESQVIGVIEVRDEKDRGGFEAEEEKLLKVFCAQAAVAITSAQKFSAIMDRTEPKNSDHDAAEYLKAQRGMNLASDDIGSFEYKMDEIQLKGAIGTGSYGEVYRALVRSKIVAVKKLHVRNLKAEQVDAFCKEASLMCQLNHQNVVQFIGAVTEPSNLCIITQFCARGSLADLLLDEHIQMSIARKLKFALDAARGMLYLHSSNPVILHRDLKSDNLLVGRDWTVKVGDFGLTRFLSEKKAMTQVGTPMWMAPEIIIGKQYTEKADVYAFGIILWEILTRLEPYEDKEPMQIVVEVVNDHLRPTIPDEFKSSPLVPLMKDCWHAEPDQRPTFSIVVERLSRLFEEEIKIHPLEKDESDGADGGEEPTHPGDNPNNKRPSRVKDGAAGAADTKTPPTKTAAAGGPPGGAVASVSKPAPSAAAAAAPPALNKQPSVAQPNKPGGK